MKKSVFTALTAFGIFLQGSAQEKPGNVFHPCARACDPCRQKIGLFVSGNLLGYCTGRSKNALDRTSDFFLKTLTIPAARRTTVALFPPGESGIDLVKVYF